MKEVTLESGEYKEIAIIVDKYHNIDNDLNRIQKQLEELDIEKTSLLQKLEKVREAENTFFDLIEKKYGKGKLDLTTFKYITL